MLNKKVILMVLLLPLIIFGCTTDEDQGNSTRENAENTNPGEEEVAGFFPFLEGMHYEYRGEGIEYAAFIRDIKHIDRPFIQIHDNNGGTTIATIYKVEPEQVSIISRQEEFYSDENLLLELDENVRAEEIIIKAPIKKGTTWDTNDKKMEIVETGLVLEVTAGRYYDVIKIKSNRLDGENETVNYIYYAKNVGLVKRESIGENFRIISELEAYENL